MKKMLSYKKIILLTIAVFVFAGISIAQSSIIDRTFGNNGYQLVNFTDVATTATEYATLRTPDGEIFTTGPFYNWKADGNSFFLIKIKPNGSPDSSFSRIGIKRYGSGSIASQQFIIQQSTKKIITFSIGGDNAYMFRFKTDGELDSTFGNNGLKTTTPKSFNSQYNVITYRFVYRQADDKIVIGGTLKLNSANERVFLYRLTANGDVDPSFSSNGLGTYFTQAFTYCRFFTPVKNDSLLIGVARLQYQTPNGYPTEDSVKLMKVDKNGIPDMTFGIYGDGIARAEFPVHYSNDNIGCTILKDNKILLMKTRNGTGILDICKFKSNGMVDSSYGTNGAFSTQTYYQKLSILKSVYRLKDGNVFALVGDYTNGQNIAMLKMLPDGTIDNSYGNGGLLSKNILINGKTGQYGHWALNADSTEIFNFGSLTATNYSSPHGLLITPQIQPDATFGNNGSYTVDIIASKDLVYDVETLGTGKIVFLGRDGLGQGIVGRLNVNGKPDVTWNQKGVIAYTSPVFNTTAYPRHVLVKRKNTISDVTDVNVHVIYVDDTAPTLFTIYKFNDSGQPDATFGINGKKSVPVTKPILTVNKALYLPDGKMIVLIGTGGGNEANDLLIVKLKTDGNRDSTFGTNGIVTIDQNKSFGCGSNCFGTDDRGGDITYTTDGKFLIGGNVNGAYSFYVVLFRLNSNGSIDNSFPKNVFDFTQTDIIIAQVLEQDAGKYIMVTNNNNYGNGTVSSDVIRYTSNGSFDPLFKYPKVPNPFGIFEVQKAELQSDKKILLLCTGGASTASNPVGKLYEVRLKEDGTVDSTFGTNGVYIFDTLSITSSTGPPDFTPGYSFFKKDRDGNIIIATVGDLDQAEDGLFIKTLGSSSGIQPLPVPIILNVNNKCFGAATSKGKLSNPPANATITITQDGNALPYSAADSSFQYFTSGVTIAGSHTISVKYSNTAATTQKDTTYTVSAGLVIPSVSISIPSVTICPATAVTFTAVSSNAGSAPVYQWQVNGINTGTNSNAFATNTLVNNDQVKVILTSNAACASPATVSSNIITITVNSSAKATGIASSPKQVCKNSSYNITFTPGNTPLTSGIQLWESINGSAYASLSTQTFNGSALTFAITNVGISTRKYFFKISTPVNACAASNNSDTTTTIIEDLVTPIITSAGDLLTVSNPDALAIYTWQLMSTGGTWNDIVPAAYGITYKATVTGDYRAKGTKNACTVYSNSEFVTVTSNIGGRVSLHPNPVKNVLTLDSLKLSDEWETLKITTPEGKEIHSYKINNTTKIIIPVINLKPGIYLAVLYRKDRSSVVLRFLKQ